MKPGRASKTAELVCTARAVAHGRTSVARFSDPTALALLPPEGQATVQRIRDNREPSGLVDKMRRAFHLMRAEMMVARTVAVDDAIRGAAAPQLVILGAGLDGRAWRMPELADDVVFEVDHPDSQRDKRARVGSLTQAARDVRFVQVDFEHDSLDVALAKTGHDATKRTMWVWEGVVMYLTRADVDATLSVIERRSAPGSCVVIVYHAPAWMLQMVGPIVRAMGEPLRSTFQPEAMRALLARHGFGVVRDDDLPTIGAKLSDSVARATTKLRHMRIATAIAT